MDKNQIQELREQYSENNRKLVSSTMTREERRTLREQQRELKHSLVRADAQMDDTVKNAIFSVLDTEMKFNKYMLKSDIAKEVMAQNPHISLRRGELAGQCIRAAKMAPEKYRVLNGRVYPTNRVL